MNSFVIYTVIRRRKVRFAGHVPVWKMRNCIEFLWWSSLEMATSDLKAYIGKQYFGRDGLDGVNSIIWLKRQTRWLAFVYTAINILVF
jgi:hypothetical protein